MSTWSLSDKRYAATQSNFPTRAAAEQCRSYLDTAGIQKGLVVVSWNTLMEIPLPASKFKPLMPDEHRVAYSLPMGGKATRALHQITDLMNSGMHVLSTVWRNKDLGMHLADIRNWNKKHNHGLSPINVTKSSVAELRLHLRCDEPRLFVGLSGNYTWGKKY
jgi:hypothetical protein